jgi:geranylgeranyl diphosphate synthase type I
LREGNDSRSRARVDEVLAQFLAAKQEWANGQGDEVATLVEAIADLVLRGGKRLRPILCLWGWRGAGRGDSDEVVTAASSLELLQACALIQDDVMDRSEVRRGGSAVHISLAEAHRRRGRPGDSDRFGAAAAILAGDLCLVWADELLRSSGIPSAGRQRAAAVYDRIREASIVGQYRDVASEGDVTVSVDSLIGIAGTKTATGTTVGPLQLGGALAGALPALQRCYAAFGEPLGVAFQLRDDLLDLYGDPHRTGKPVGTDVGRHQVTVPVAEALARADADQAEELRRLLRPGNGDVRRLAHLVEATGARDRLEARITDLTVAAAAALHAVELPPPVHAALADLATAATVRSG